ncbi:MAG: nuclear protein [Frankiales bacterium]|nr:nuclear protein [Frankiales bacterium]
MRGRRLVVKQSAIHGRGVFAKRPVGEGDEVIEYRGQVITWQEASRRYEESDQELGHTFFFDIDDGLVIDGGVGGNDSRWINHSCEPNCEFEVQGRRVVVRALRDIARGEELLLDYRLELDDQDDQGHYACRCGAPSCRRSMAAPS